MKKILIVDDDSITRGLLSRVLNSYSRKFSIITSENGKDAAEIIKNQKIDLVITDLQMPVVDGFKLLAHMSKDHPEIPVFVMTAFGTPDVDSKIKVIGPSRYFTKPLNMDTLTECIFEELDAGAEGEIRGISLPSFLQLVEMEKKTCTLRVKSEDKTGSLYFTKGEIFYAKVGNLENEKAAYELLCWEQPEIKIEDYNKKTKKEINQPLMTILMEGLKAKDEKESENKSKRPPLKPLKKFPK